MKLRKNSSSRKNNSKVSSTSRSRSGSVGNNILKTRRVVKATPPPAAPALSPVETDSASDLDSSSDRQRSRSIVTPIVSVQDEALAEKTQQWRQERLDASAAIRKEHKEKEIMEHRLRSKSSAEEEPKSTSTSSNSYAEVQQREQNKENIPRALSVSAKFPEHKRKAGSDEDHEVGKKPRNEALELDAERGGGGESWRARAFTIVKASAPGIAVALVAILTFKLVRKK